MVDDILLTPEEQDERAKKWLKDNGLALILGVGLGLGAVFGYQTYQTKIKTDAEQASLLYSQVLNAVQSSELADISEDVAVLKNDYGSSPYAAKAVLLRAKQLAVSNLDEAAAELEWVAEGAEDIGLRHTARIRLAKVLVAAGKLDEAKAVAEQKPYNGFDSSYAEILGDIAVSQQDFAEARGHYESAIATLSPADRGYAGILELKLNRLPASVTATAQVDDVEGVADVEMQDGGADEGSEEAADETSEKP